MTCDADELDIYSQKESFSGQTLPLGLPVPRLSLTLQDGHWVTEETMSASLRDTTEPSTWFRCLFRLRVFAVAPLAGQIAMGSCCHQRTMRKLHACASVAPEFECCEVASYLVA